LFKNFSPEIKRTIALIGGLGVAFAAIAGPALTVIGGITIGLGSIVSMAGSVMGAIGGITASLPRFFYFYILPLSSLSSLLT
jgi:hypothetical protein